MLQPTPDQPGGVFCSAQHPRVRRPWQRVAARRWISTGRRDGGSVEAFVAAASVRRGGRMDSQRDDVADFFTVWLRVLHPNVGKSIPYMDYHELFGCGTFWSSGNVVLAHSPCSI